MLPLVMGQGLAGVRHSGSTAPPQASGETLQSQRFQQPFDYKESAIPVDEPARVTQDEEEKWWPLDTKWTGGVRRDYYDNTKKPLYGMHVPELKEVPDPKRPELTGMEADSFYNVSQLVIDDSHIPKDRRLPAAATFDPAIDEIEENDFMSDIKMRNEIERAAHRDKLRLQQLGNPITVEDQLDFLLQPQRSGDEQIKQQREDFNGFLHWGLQYAATVALDQEMDPKKAHQFINRYLRDIDLFEQWSKHPKVVAHMKKKFNIDINNTFDKLMAMTSSLYIRSKIQCVEGDFAGALKSLVGASGLLNEAGVTTPKRKKLLGAILAARGLAYYKLSSPERAEEDLTHCLAYMPRERCATVYQLRAECREALGRLDEAREDEERAADIWEHAETVHPGMDHEPVKWIV